jgi:phosphoserine phosphatase
MAVFYVCRHGQTEYNAQDKLQGWFDTPLTPAAITSAHSVARKLADKSIDTIYSSDLGRAFITAYLISRDIGYEKEIIRSPDLREVSFGDLSGMQLEKVEELYHRVQNATTFVPPHGEALGHMQKRVLTFIKSLATQKPGELSLLVTHDCVINALYTSFKKDDFGEYNTDHTNAYDQVVKIEVDGSGSITSFSKC